MFEPTKINKKTHFGEPPFYCEFLNQILPNLIYALLAKHPHSTINNLTINITETDWSFIKALNINHSLQRYTRQMHTDA